MTLELRPQVIHAASSEAALIGCAIYDREASREAIERVRPDHFHDPLFARLWAYILGVSGPTDPGILADVFAKDESFGKLGGIGFLAELIDTANPLAVPAHVEAILDAATRRELAHLARDLQNRASAEPGQGETLLAEMEQGAAEIARRHVATPKAVSAGIDALDMLEAAANGEFHGSPVGLEAIDRVTGGIRQDDVWFIGGRTSMGKSVAGLCLTRGIARQGRGVLMFSLEMPRREVQSRLIADLAYDRSVSENGMDGGNVRYGDILKGRGTSAQWTRAKHAAKALASLPFVVNDQGGLTIEDIRSQALRQFRAWERAGVQPGALLIDHIGLVKPSNRRGGDSKAAETADIVNELKALAKSVGAPVIALCQVNRNTENRQDKRPTMADLNWSGAIEQIADFVCLLYRDAYYLERSQDEDDRIEAVRKKYDLELLIQKNRSGPICNVQAFIDVACNAIRDLEPEQGEGRAWR